MAAFEQANEATQELWLQEIETIRDSLSAGQVNLENQADCTQLKAYFTQKEKEAELRSAALGAQQNHLSKQITHLKSKDAALTQHLQNNIATKVTGRSTASKCTVS